MKKILTAFLLIAFCSVQATWAGEVVIIGSDGQARYEDESKNIKFEAQNKEIIMNNKKKVLNEVTITVENGESKSLYIDNNYKIKKIVDNDKRTDITKFITKEQNEEFQNYINNATKVITDHEYPKAEDMKMVNIIMKK